LNEEVEERPQVVFNSAMADGSLAEARTMTIPFTKLSLRAVELIESYTISQAFRFARSNLRTFQDQIDVQGDRENPSSASSIGQKRKRNNMQIKTEFQREDKNKSMRDTSHWQDCASLHSVRETKEGTLTDRISVNSDNPSAVNSDNPSAPTASEGSDEHRSDPVGVIQKEGYYIVNSNAKGEKVLA